MSSFFSFLTTFIFQTNGGLFISTSGTYVLYGNQANSLIPEFENYIQASGKLILDEQSTSSDGGGQFVQTEGKMIMPNISSGESEYDIYAGTFLPVDYGDLSFGRDKDREIKN